MDETRGEALPPEPPYLFRPDTDRKSLCAKLDETDLTVVEAQERETEVVATLQRDCEEGLRLRFLPSEAEPEVERLSEAVCFLPKVSWRLAHTDMLLNGFRSGKWHGIGLQDPRGKQLVSYLDYAVKKEAGEVEVGFCMTHPDWRGRGLVTRLLAVLVLLYFDHSFRISTHEANVAMSRALRHFGFSVSTRLPRDRINGEMTLYLTRTPGTAFDLRS